MKLNPCAHALLGALACLASTACSPTHHQHATPVVAQMGLKNLKQPRPFILTSGQPTKDQLETLSKEGIKHIVNLRPKSEQEWDEEKRVKSLGMNYISIPISGADDLTPENIEAFDRALNTIGKDPALIHCASGNRVGAMAALRDARVNQSSTHKAIKTGKSWGLTSLEPAVRNKLQE